MVCTDASTVSPPLRCQSGMRSTGCETEIVFGPVILAPVPVAHMLSTLSCTATPGSVGDLQASCQVPGGTHTDRVLTFSLLRPLSAFQIGATRVSLRWMYWWLLDASGESGQ